MLTTTRGAAVAALGALLVGCGGGGAGSEKIVAKAGDIVITLADFQAAYTQISQEARPDISTLEGKRSFASDLVNQRILLREGERITGQNAELIRSQTAQARQKKMLELLYREEVEEKVEVLGADVKEMYDRRLTNVRAQHILVETLDDAQRIREEIASGSISFEDAAANNNLVYLNKLSNNGFFGELDPPPAGLPPLPTVDILYLHGADLPFPPFPFDEEPGVGNCFEKNKPKNGFTFFSSEPPFPDGELPTDGC